MKKDLSFIMKKIYILLILLFLFNYPVLAKQFELFPISPLVSHINGIPLSTAFSLDGELFAVSKDKNFEVEIYNPNTTKSLMIIRNFNGPLNSICFSPNKDLLAGVDRKNIVIWTIKDQKIKLKLPLVKSSTNLIFNNKGDLLFGIPGINQICAWNINTGNKEFEIKNTKDKTNIDRITLSSDNKLLAANWGDSVKIWELPEGKEIKLLDCYKNDKVTSLVFSPDNRFIATGSSNGIIKIWHVKDWSLLGSLQNNNKPIIDLYFNKDSEVLISHDINNISIWNIICGSLLLKQPLNSPCYVSYCYENNLLSSWDTEPFLWILKDIEPKMNKKLIYVDKNELIYISNNNNKQILFKGENINNIKLSSSGKEVFFFCDGDMFSINILNKKLKKMFKRSKFVKKTDKYITSDSKFIALNKKISNNKFVPIVLEQKSLKRTELFARNWLAIGFSNDNTYLILKEFLSSNTQIYLYNIYTNQLFKKWKLSKEINDLIIF